MLMAAGVATDWHGTLLRIKRIFRQIIAAENSTAQRARSAVKLLRARIFTRAAKKSKKQHNKMSK